eukprot:m.30683 g.30683  ORF g.30683 m.30683 type:complete len:93 (-) comp12250_c0_seq2:89-367(-)
MPVCPPMTLDLYVRVNWRALRGICKSQLNRCSGCHFSLCAPIDNPDVVTKIVVQAATAYFQSNGIKYGCMDGIPDVTCYPVPIACANGFPKM